MSKMNKNSSATLPPAYNQVEKHPVFPVVSHDESARYNFLSSLNKYITTVVQPGNRVVFERRVKPAFMAQIGRDFEAHDEVQTAMQHDANFQLWSALHRSATEMHQQAGRSLVLRQLDDLATKTGAFGNQRPESLHLDPAVTILTYLTAVDNHAMPGGYYATYIPGDVSNAANFDAGLFVKHAGTEGRLSDGPSRALVAWLKRNYPDFQPERVLDLGCGTGNNTLPLAIGYPDAQITGIDVSAAMLRYSHARSVGLNVLNVDFLQANAEQLPYADASVDWVQTTAFLHETSKAALENIIKEIYRVLKPGGLMLHLEQPQYTPDVHLFEQSMREWKAQLTNLPFRAVMYGMGMKNWMISGGFTADKLLQFSAGAIAETDDFTQPDQQEDYTPAIAWNAFGAWK
ncbi:class I SAM-dependent methyltransferase [uncultured Fibrella sp.]|uniref:class I SAM-dependent methyltransferase n=1 Tax=uncultured Fibrella sp. TaxID=1284596 RepID=UPI0035CA5ACA